MFFLDNQNLIGTQPFKFSFLKKANTLIRNFGQADSPLWQKGVEAFPDFPFRGRGQSGCRQQKESYPSSLGFRSPDQAGSGTG